MPVVRIYAYLLAYIYLWEPGGAQANRLVRQASKPTGQQATGIWHKRQETRKRAKPAGSLWAASQGSYAERLMLTYFIYTYLLYLPDLLYY